jgi:prolycopene isomerase
METISKNMQASKNSYDVIVIGAGISGLISGALLAKEGKQVLVVEQETNPGGFAREFDYGSYAINPAIHSIMGCNPAGPFDQGVINAVLSHLGTLDQCEFISLNPFYRVHFPNFQMDVPTGREAYLDAHLKHFPEEADALHDLVDLCAIIFREFLQFPSVLRLQDWMLMPFRYPKMFRYANATVGRVVNKFISNSQLRSIYSILYPYLALPPSRLSFLLWATMMASFIEEGAFYCVGGFQKFVHALVEGLSSHGGELVVNSRVKKIRTIHTKAQGVLLENGQEISAPMIVSSIKPGNVFNELIETDQIPDRYIAKLGKLETSCSCLGIYLATKLDIYSLGIPKVTLVSPWNLESAYAAAGKGLVEAMAVHVPSVVDNTLAPPGENVVVLQALIQNHAIDLTTKSREKFADSLIHHAEKVLPGLRDNITYIAGSLEEGHGKFPLHKLENIYGWANSTKQAGPLRLAYKTPLSGLYLTGHWTQPGSGIWTVVLSGISAAKYVLGKDLSDSIWPLNFP